MSLPLGGDQEEPSVVMKAAQEGACLISLAAFLTASSRGGNLCESLKIIQGLGRLEPQLGHQLPENFLPAIGHPNSPFKKKKKGMARCLLRLQL